MPPYPPVPQPMNSIIHMQYICTKLNQYSQAYDAISSTICQYFTSIIPHIHYILVQRNDQPNDDKDYWRS